jgi:glycosyltransferase involved in cell wall biosynthesis
VARRSGLPLVIAGIVQDEAYFRAEVEPHLGHDGITYVGPVGPAERDRLLGGALALLHLIDFEEPFGLSVVESLAVGTPVIATPLGSLPELIDDGRTGFLVADADAAVGAVARLPRLERAECRREAQTRFSDQRMVADYERLFERIATIPR